MALSAGPCLALSATTFFPSDGATGVCPDAPLKITFDAAPSVGTSGAVRIYHASGALVETLDLALSAADGTQVRTIGGTVYNAYTVLVSGNTATVFPRAGALAYNATYYVTVDAGVFPGFAGVSGTAAWRFTTQAAAPSAAAAHLVVAADGSGDFCTVQGAVDWVPAGNTARRTINVRSGTYQEIVRVPSKHNLAFRGQNRKRTVIAYPNNSTINPNTSTRPLFGVFANDVSFDNLTLSNTTPDGGSQAEALRISGQRCVVANSDVHSFQDTLLINSASDTAYVVDSLVEGDADFIWGSGRAVFQRCEIKSLSGGYLCMARNPAGQFGAVFLDCRLTRSAGVAGVYLARIDPSVYTNSAVAFVNCAMDAHIAPAGWLLTAGGPTNDLRFWEHQSTDLSGAALNVSGRAAFSAQISAAQAAALRDLPATFGGWRPVPPLPAFPGAEGAGARALGGRGGDVYAVTTLADAGTGSLRDAVATAPAAGRTVLFRVSGTIALNSVLNVTKPRITIAGQTAPGDGVCLKNYSLRIDADDVVVRHLRSRLGTGALQEDDAITVWGGINVLLDHCSASWSVDEVLSSTGETDNLTVQWCVISEALDNSIHSKGPHGFGSIIASYLPARISFHHNLYAHNQSRNPRPGNYASEALSLDFRNNVVYDWGYFIGYNSGELMDLNYVGNYFVKGPGSSSETAFRSGGAATRLFQSGNKLDLNRNGAFDGADTGWSMFGGTYTAQTSAFETDPSQTSEAAERALQRVLSQAGAFPWQRDAKDRAVALDVLNGTGGFVDTTDQAGGYPELTSSPARVDSDGDGMPDFWESAVGLSPSSAGNNLDSDGDGYTDLEDYLNWLAAPNAVVEVNAPVGLDLNTLNGGRTNVTYALSAATNGTAVLQPDGHTARFVPATNFAGRASFAFSFTALGHTVTQTVGICVSAGLPADLTWRGATVTWDLGATTNFLKAGAPAAFRNGDTVTFDNSGVSSNVTLSAILQPSLVAVAAARDYSFSGTGVLAGAMSLLKTGSGTLALVSSNAYSGGTAVSGGALTLGHVRAAGSGPISLENASLAVGALKPANALAVAGTNLINGANGGGLGAMTGDGVVTLAVPSGIFDLNGSQSGFSGTLALTSNASMRIVGTTGSTNATFDLGPGTAVLYNRTGTATVWLGALKGGGGTMLKGYSNGTTLTTYVVGGSGEDSSFAGSIRSGDGGGGTAPTALTKVGAGTLTLSGSNTYSGATLVSEGTLRVTGSLAATAVTVASNATLCGAGRIAGPVAVQPGGRLGAAAGAAGTLSLGAGLSLADAALTLNLGSAATAGSGVNDLLSLSGGALTLSGTVTVTPNLLGGPLTNGTYTLISGGTATVSTATLVWGGSEIGGRQRVAFDTGTPGALKLVVTGMPAALRWSGASGATWDSGDPTNEASGAPNWRNGGAADRFVKFDSVTFDDSLTAGAAAVSGSVEPHSVLVSNVTKSVSISAVTGSIVGATSLVKCGGGTLTLDGTNTFAGGLALYAGTVQLASDGANAYALGSGPVTLKGGALSMYANFGTYNSVAWDLDVPQGCSGTLNCDSRCYLYGRLTGAGALNVYVPDIRTEFDGDWSAFAGQLNVSTDANGGDFRIGNNYTPFGLPRAALSLGPKVALYYVGILGADEDTVIELGALNGHASSVLRGGPTVATPPRTLTWVLGKRGEDMAFAGTVAEQAAGCVTALTKIGAGALRLGGACSNVGPTTVAGGRLLVNGRVSASPIGVGSGAALGGTGTVAAVSLARGAALEPGDGGAGVLTVAGPLTLDAGSVLNFEFGSDGDLVNVASNLALNGTLNIVDLGGLSAGSRVLFTYGGVLSGAGLTLGRAPTNFTYAVDTATAGQVRLVVTSVLSPFQEWQVLWFGSTTAPEAAASADPDGDGQTNADEYQAATSPTSAASVAMLYWRGDGASNLWDIAASSNFWNGARRSNFADGNPVTFDASGSANPTVRLAAAVSPASVLVSNTAAFTFLGAGAVAGTGTLTKAGSGTLTVNTTNSHSGGTTVSGGTSVAAGGGTLGAGRLTVEAGATCAVQNVSGAIANSATVYLSGTLNLAAGVTDTVQRLFLDGVLQREGLWNAARDAAHFTGAGALSVTDGMPDSPSESFMAAWTNKLAVSFVNAAPGETLTNFPLLVVLGTNIAGFSYAQFASPAGADLRFTDRAQTNELSYEIERWNTNGLSYVWVRVPALSRASSLLAHWGNAELAYFPACATNGSTWSEGFLGVWHLSETGGQHRDASPARAASELVQVTAQGSAAGVAGGADRLDGVNDYVDLPSMGTQAQVTVECWANLAAVPLAADIGLVSSDPWSSGVAHFKTSTNLQVKVQINGGGTVNSGANLLSVSNWFYAAYTVAGSGASSLKSYCNAALIGSSGGSANNNLTDVNIGREYNGRYLNARVDEVRISSVARSPAWLWATYQNLASNATFSSYGSAGPLASNRPPALAALADRTVGAGQWLSVASSATDPDLPPQALSFSLQNAPSGMAVNAGSGLITWRPTVAQAGAHSSLQVVVADAGWPIACATQAFSVTVSPVAQPAVAQPLLVGGRLYLGVSGDAGPDYSVQASSNLVDWATVFTTNSPAPPFLWADTNATLYRTRFYRVLIGP